MLLRRDAFTPLLTGFFIQGFFYTKQLLHTGDTQVLLQTDAFSQQCFYTHVLYTGSFVTQSILYTRKTLAQILLHGDVRCFYTQVHLYTGVFYTQVFARILLHRDAFTQELF